MIHLQVIAFIFFFSFSALLPLIPQLNLETAGWAFTCYYIFKVLWYLPAGKIGDWLGHYNALLLALGLQAGALGILWISPQWAILARIIEGIALAQSTISSLSTLRLQHTEGPMFSTSVNRLMLAGSVGFFTWTRFWFYVLSGSQWFTFVVLDDRDINRGGNSS
ncbi:MAG: hypothetical protein IPJ84_14680 [Bdellovibrionales bacterium]|nr:hypothetical protein [Bdellovibrionales bacterium]